MEKFELYDLEEALTSQKMRDVYRSLVDVEVEGTEAGYLKSISARDLSTRNIRQHNKIINLLSI